jgi:hypothetical protein
MHKVIRLSLIAGTVASLALTGCSKTEDPAPAAPATTPSTSPTIIMSDGYGVLAAVRSVSITTVAGMTIPVELNTAVAAFPVAMGSSSFADAGTVTLNSKGLTKSTNNAYVYQNLTDPLSFNSLNWSVSGSSSVPAINYSDDQPIPDYSGFDALPTTISKAAGVTISLGSAISNADSVYVTITDYNNHQVLKRLSGNAVECTVSSAELSGLTAGQGMVQVVPWNYKSEDISGKKFYFVVETAYTKQGITIN